MTSPHQAPPRDATSVLSTSGRSAVPVDEAYREHARRLARAIIQQGNADPEQQEV